MVKNLLVRLCLNTRCSTMNKKHVDEWYNKYLEKEQNGFCLSKPSDKDKATFEEVDTSGIDTTDCREVGAEWLCLNIVES